MKWWPTRRQRWTDDDVVEMAQGAVAGSPVPPRVYWTFGGKLPPEEFFTEVRAFAITHYGEENLFHGLMTAMQRLINGDE